MHVFGYRSRRTPNGPPESVSIERWGTRKSPEIYAREVSLWVENGSGFGGCTKAISTLGAS